ncbi:MAG: hypothetical protein JW767_10855 [Thermoleophilia bacterium]|nr:hypothetical protein [Thermoleophilia bacterium]
MYVLNFWHTVPDYTEWKKVFDSDPLGREASGVRRHTLTRPVDDEHTVIGALAFDSLGEAEAFAIRLREVWEGLGSGLVADAGSRISEVLEEKVFDRETERKAA